jgi:DNA-binding PadR family transcriptional regulator
MARGLSFAAVSVLHAIARGYEYGFDVIDATGLPSGTVYPALTRLERDGYLRSDWEEEKAAHAEKRPPRRYYRITAPGIRTLEAEVKRYRALGPVRRGAPARGRG